ncbi:helix-turn-helix domain-containing protein [Novosphingobium sp. FSY-8]|uniref:Helix-turn-helix domain-containing protein n=1 Tax=Novosphingobium ovatum TaxID=1908523 RepID=A0ABW9XAV7_9SPHN|nr:Crp/Fnr family transcriptional regulator [Novosphingobium ovatum]NBC35649.1 helix-turn-helix domain-containing protein [Novosphingobium ovatum]
MRTTDTLAPPITVPAGTVLFRAGQDCTGFVVVRDGVVRVTLTGESGREIVLYRVAPGDICLQTFGCLVDGTPYAAQGVAETALTIEILPPARFHALVAQDADFRARLFGAVARRFADMERLVEEVALTGIPARLARALLRLADGGAQVDVTHETLASEIGSAREVVSRQLSVWARGGLIESGRGHLGLTNPAALRQIAEAG